VNGRLIGQHRLKTEAAAGVARRLGDVTNGWRGGAYLALGSACMTGYGTSPRILVWLPGTARDSLHVWGMGRTRTDDDQGGDFLCTIMLPESTIESSVHVARAAKRGGSLLSCMLWSKDLI